MQVSLDKMCHCEWKTVQSPIILKIYDLLEVFIWSYHGSMHNKFDRQTKGMYLTHEFVYRNKIHMWKMVAICIYVAIAHTYAWMAVSIQKIFHPVLHPMRAFMGHCACLHSSPNSQRSTVVEAGSPVTMWGSSWQAAHSYIFQLKQIVEGLLKQEIWDDSTFTAAI